MRKRRFLRALLASAVIGLVEATGLGGTPRHRRRPLRVVWLDDREPADPLGRAGVWFLDPLGDPRPEASDVRRPAPLGLRLVPLAQGRITRGLLDRRS